MKKRKPRTGAVSATEHGRAQGHHRPTAGRIEELEEELTAARERIAELEAHG